MDIESYFLNQGWICVYDIKKNDLLKLLNLKVSNSISWEQGTEIISNKFDEKIFLNFKIEKWEFLIGKYYFLDHYHETLKVTMNQLSEKSSKVKAFAIDVWSNYYCYSKFENGKNVRLWNLNDRETIEEGNLSIEEEEAMDEEIANKILEIAHRTTVKFETIEEFMLNNKVDILEE